MLETHFEPLSLFKLSLQKKWEGNKTQTSIFNNILEQNKHNYYGKIFLHRLGYFRLLKIVAHWSVFWWQNSSDKSNRNYKPLYCPKNQQALFKIIIISFKCLLFLIQWLPICFSEGLWMVNVRVGVISMKAYWMIASMKISWLSTNTSFSLLPNI